MSPYTGFLKFLRSKFPIVPLKKLILLKKLLVFLHFRVKAFFNTLSIFQKNLSSLNNSDKSKEIRLLHNIEIINRSKKHETLLNVL